MQDGGGIDPACGFEQLGAVPTFDDSSPSDETDEADDLDTPQHSVDQQLRPVVRRAQLPTGVCYDDRMKLHANADFGGKPHHPEDPGRIERIYHKFKQAGLIFQGSEADAIEVRRKNPTLYMWKIPCRQATEKEICTVHLERHYDWVRSLSEKSTEELRSITKLMDAGRESIYVGSMTFEAALISAGGAIETCKAVVRGDVKNAFAVIRPPGHHAEYDCPMGFCMFNNVPVAAKVCQLEYPDLCRRILILDWDVHHGNGIQNIFYDNPNVLYISTHVYQNGHFYPAQPDDPNIPDGGLDKCGADGAQGKNINIGWHDQGMGDGEYMAAFQRIIMPIAQEFNPDLVIISAGFDAANGDELGGCFVTPECYAHMTHMLMSLANGKVAVCLEGGYNLTAISNSALAVAQTLMGEPPPTLHLPQINAEAHKTLELVRTYQAPFWQCMRPGVIDVPEIEKEEGKRLTDVLRTSQLVEFAEKFDMYPLYIQREALFRTYDNQVLVSRNIESAKNILVILHDPPELLGQPDSLNNTIPSGNAWVVDQTPKFVEWAVSKDFGIMDINVPRFPPNSQHYIHQSDEARLQAEIRELVCYLWDNYLQLYDGDLFIMGVGFAYIGIKILLLNRTNIDCKFKFSGVINFVNGPLRPIKSDVDEHLSTWYKHNSRVFVASNHLCWLDAGYESKTRKKRFGTVIRSPEKGLNAMMRRHAEEVQEFIWERRVTSEGDTTEEDPMVS
ncbi:Arginase/deacetylase [Cryphonectria parasitica EP155]|uniref:Histone deacetylase n=1 Tax=Cryphonectria parasitica (strain ATCC 38755 / EP155) TaxID=660469 RepID=A0A9P5CQS5_CRYP1|nr:Arginase/deacetylase [Cryphonectria parasitica EP155]KAF3766385.1 Arginase/deacetylase [Cryphonectria parasitica EP155]